MHLQLDDFNQMLRGQISKAERNAFADHILDCEACAVKYKMLRELDIELHQALGTQPEKPARARVPLRYIIGVAAVMLMAVSPYLLTSKEMGSEPDIVASNDFRPGQVLSMVREVSFRDAVADWGKETNLSDLVKMQNRTN